jgi:hypothetical protein
MSLWRKGGFNVNNRLKKRGIFVKRKVPDASLINVTRKE